MPEYTDTSKHTYELLFKIYEPAHIAELPFDLPVKLIGSNSVLKLGYHSSVMTFTQEEFDNYCDQVHNHENIVKIIGTERLD